MAKTVVSAQTTYKIKEKYKKFFQPKSHTRSVTHNWENFSFSPNFFNRPKSSFSKLTSFLLFKNKRTTFKISLKSASSFFIKTSTFSGVRRLLAPFFRGKKIKLQSKLNFNIFTTFNFTKKPLAVRIGGGVGKKLRFSGSFVNKGFEILTIYSTKPFQIYKRLLKLKKKFSGRTVVSIRLLFFMYKEAQIFISDNTGARKLKLIGTYKFHNVYKSPASLFMSSLSKVVPKRKLKKGSLFRAFTIRVRFLINRYNGISLACSANRAILFKPNDLLPLANRLKCYVVMEVFTSKEVVFPAITIYMV